MAWISISDILPPDNEEVITYEDDGFYRIAYILDNCWFDHNGQEFQPQYWMWLPPAPTKKKPPQEGGKS